MNAEKKRTRRNFNLLYSLTISCDLNTILSIWKYLNERCVAFPCTDRQLSDQSYDLAFIYSSILPKRTRTHLWGDELVFL